MKKLRGQKGRNGELGGKLSLTGRTRPLREEEGVTRTCPDESRVSAGKRGRGEMMGGPIEIACWVGAGGDGGVFGGGAGGREAHYLTNQKQTWRWGTQRGLPKYPEKSALLDPKKGTRLKTQPHEKRLEHDLNSALDPPPVH